MVIKNVDALLKDLWENRTVGLTTTQPLDFISQAVLVYLRERYPYLQMINLDAKFQEVITPKFKEAPSGWVIHDYGEAISSSPGKHLYGPGNPEIEETDTSGGTGSGTLVRQTVDTARAMIELAIEKGWTGVEIVDGTNRMQWAAWMVAQEKDYTLVGYQPGHPEQKKWERIKRTRISSVKPSQKPQDRPT